MQHPKTKLNLLKFQFLITFRQDVDVAYTFEPIIYDMVCSLG